MVGIVIFRPTGGPQSLALRNRVHTPRSGRATRSGPVRQDIKPYEKNKSENPVPFFSATKASINAPRLPRNPPRFHHKSTTTNTHFSAKPPAKTPIHHAKKMYVEKTQIPKT